MKTLFDKDTWQEIFSSIGQNKVRTIITIIGVLWGIFLYIVLSGAAKGVDNGFERQFERISSNSLFVWGEVTSVPYDGFKTGRWINFKLSDVTALKNRIPEIQHIAPRNSSGVFGGSKAQLVNGQKKGSYNIYGDFPILTTITTKNIFEGGRFINESDILSEMQGAIFSGGGDYPANDFIIGSGHNALLCRYQSEKRNLSPTDQLSLEWAGTYKHYHSAMFRTIPIGKADPKHIKMHEACVEALTNCVKTLVPGKTAGEVFDTHAKTFDDLGFNKARMNACGYSLGSTFSPNWMDWPMLYTGNPYKIVPGNVFFMHMILMDSDNNLAMNLGETYLITENGNQRLGKQKLDLVIL